MGLWDDKKFRFARMKLIGRVKDYWSIIENLHLRETTLPKIKHLEIIYSPVL